MAGETSLDSFFDGALVLRQPQKGHRIGSDAVLLAAACPPTEGLVCDMGAGVGAVGLRIAQVNAAARVDLAEIDATAAELAAENARLNRLVTRVAVHSVDILSRDFGRGVAGPAPQSFDIVVTNPPYFEPGRTRPSPDAARRRAHVGIAPLEAWMRACIFRLRPKGALIAIHRADALVQVLGALEGRLGGLRLRFVHPRATAPAHRMLVFGRRGSRAPPLILPPLVLHASDGAFTPEAEAIHRGRASLGWD